MTEAVDAGVRQIAERIHLRLQRYLEAQYHIRNTGLIEERRVLLREPASISQLPYVELTPSYSTRPTFAGLQLPSVVRDLLVEMSNWKPSVGVYPPYGHQANAIEAFFSPEGRDLVVATGTGSGKTEAFLYSILGSLALEASERRESFGRRGVRALLLYPMNALVSDQTARLRKLFGDERLAAHFRSKGKRHPQFGMYTSRTPYPGVRTGGRDQRQLAPLVKYYADLEKTENEETKALVGELNRRGRWPAKDMVAFFAQDVEEARTYAKGARAGKTWVSRNWDLRFQTQPMDRELLTRQEMQEHVPDILVTNYSMLEYMLLRPLERPLFAATKAWLDADKKNQFLLILDEAHMYRGVGGAEVGLLIRRLQSRLGIARDRMRCILTSASLGSGPETQVATNDFAKGLTGDHPSRSFLVLGGTKEDRRGDRPGTPAEALALAALPVQVVAAARVQSEEAVAAIGAFAKQLGWPPLPPVGSNDLPLRQYVALRLTGFGPLELLIKRAAGNATEFSELAVLLFPDVDRTTAERATDGLLALGSFARRTEKDREEQPLTPARVHLLFRGLPPLYVCANPACNARRFESGQAGVAGRIYLEPKDNCGCGGRVFELLTHRDCGAAFIRAYGLCPEPDFLWDERGGTLTEFGRPLHELHLLLEEPHPEMQGKVEIVQLDILTGKVVEAAGDERNTRRCYRPKDPAGSELNLSTFSECPVCRRPTRTGQTNGGLKIMDLATKGEQPFANLVREQFVAQAPTASCDERHPNEGRKALLFSDGRQKAARLARDLPREVERDSFREALVLAADALSKLPEPKEVVLAEDLYTAFISVCSRHHLHFFDGDEQGRLVEQCQVFRNHYDGDLALAFDDAWKPPALTRYRQALIRQIGDPYYSLVAACAAVVEPRANKMRVLQRQVGGVLNPEALSQVTSAWVAEMLRRGAFDPALTLDNRRNEFSYFEPIRREDGLKNFFDKIGKLSGLGQDQVGDLREKLFEVFTSDVAAGDNSGRLLAPDGLRLRLALDDTWLQCRLCNHLQTTPLLGRCANCGSPTLEARPPDHPYMVARKGYFREPLRDVLRGERPVHITAEEHTAQLSQRDAGVVYATTEQFELRFQDVPLGNDKPPVDVLSCTTTMEVGIDIGSLTAVGLRTVPPQRENYQQRAGRAGRRGTSISTVLTYAQGGAHDAHYFANPAAIISGDPRQPRIKSDNERLARRHLNSYLLQTFFHSQIDALSPAHQQELARSRPGLMSAFGTADEFFRGDEAFSLTAFDAWLKERVLVPSSRVADQAVAWLPPALAKGTDRVAYGRKLVRECAKNLTDALRKMQFEFSTTKVESQDGKEASAESEESDTKSESLLDLLFDRGVLPSYAFPTDLCSFVIQEWDDRKIRVKERPQLGKSQALSEYAPGRLLVVNKKTYRVGGVFVEGPPTASPGAILFSRPLQRYVGCRLCGFVRIESSEQQRTPEGTPCPVCKDSLFVREMLDPPAFVPQDGRELAEGDREQDITYASSAQLPELVGRDDFHWKADIGKNLQYAYGEDVLLVVANKGKDEGGFSICDRCGGAWLDGDEPSGPHRRPFLVSKATLDREGASRDCTGNVQRGMFLGHDFRTDLLLLRVAVRDPLDFSPNQPWLFDALATLSEALALGASLHLDIDPGELSAGFRLLPGLAGEKGAAELYLYDTAAGGAGYAADAGADLARVLARTRSLLERCPGKCERSCTKCLRHYGNRFLHPRLDRKLALGLLEYTMGGEIATVLRPDEQRRIMMPLARMLTLAGWSKSGDVDDSGALRMTNQQGELVRVVAFPALLAPDIAARQEQAEGSGERPVIRLPDYLLQRDLPSSYQRVVERPAQPKDGGRPAAPGPKPPGEKRSFAVRDIRALNSTRVTGQEVKLRTGPVSADAFAARVPSGVLAKLGLSAGAWLVLRPFSKQDLDVQQQVVILRPRGKFRATGDSWTVAKVRPLADGGSRLQIGYGRTEAAFRPERVEGGEVLLAATVLQVVANEDA